MSPTAVVAVAPVVEVPPPGPRLLLRTSSSPPGAPVTAAVAAAAAPAAVEGCCCSWLSLRLPSCAPAESEGNLILRRYFCRWLLMW